MAVFVVREHVFEGQHIRQYHGALAANQEAIVRLHAKSYTPREVDNGSVRGQMTFIAFHANAIPKECYEVFFEALHNQLKSCHNITLGSIWIADQAFQNASARLNDECMGNDAHWFDHSRDVLQMINTFRKHMQRPLIAIGHSMGGSQVVSLSHIHPRLFEATIMLDPAMTMTFAANISIMLKWTARKKTSFKSAQDVEKNVRKNPAFTSWNPRVVQAYIKYAFHDGPTTLQPNTDYKPRTGLYAELRAIVRPNHNNVKPYAGWDPLERYKFPDVSLESPLTGPFYNPQTRDAYALSKSHRPSTLLVLGEGSRIGTKQELDQRTNIIGTGTGGSGGTASGNVSSITIAGGHFLPMTNPTGTANSVGDWLSVWYKRYMAIEEALAKEAASKTLAEKQSWSSEVMSLVDSWDGNPWPNSQAPKDGGASRVADSKL